MLDRTDGRSGRNVLFHTKRSAVKLCNSAVWISLNTSSSFQINPSQESEDSETLYNISFLCRPQQ